MVEPPPGAACCAGLVARTRRQAAGAGATASRRSTGALHLGGAPIRRSLLRRVGGQIPAASRRGRGSGKPEHSKAPPPASIRHPRVAAHRDTPPGGRGCRKSSNPSAPPWWSPHPAQLAAPGGGPDPGGKPPGQGLRQAGALQGASAGINTTPSSSRPSRLPGWAQSAVAERRLEVADRRRTPSPIVPGAQIPSRSPCERLEGRERASARATSRPCPGGPRGAGSEGAQGSCSEAGRASRQAPRSDARAARLGEAGGRSVRRPPLAFS